MAGMKFTQGLSSSAYGVALIGVLTTDVVASIAAVTGAGWYEWTMLAVPIGSAVPTGLINEGASATSASPFAPDVAYSYRVRVRVYTAQGGTLLFQDVRCFAAADTYGNVLPVADSTDADNETNWAVEPQGRTSMIIKSLGETTAAVPDLHSPGPIGDTVASTVGATTVTATTVNSTTVNATTVAATNLTVDGSTVVSQATADWTPLTPTTDYVTTALPGGVTITMNTDQSANLPARRGLRILDATGVLSGTGSNQITQIDATGLTISKLDSQGRLYVSTVVDGLGFCHSNVYSNSGRTTLVAHTGSYNSAGAQVLIADGGSGISGTITAADFDLVAAPNITFANVDSTITRSAGSFITDGYLVGQSLVISGSLLNDQTTYITDVDAGGAHIHVGSALVNEGPSAGINLTAVGGAQVTAIVDYLKYPAVSSCTASLLTISGPALGTGAGKIQYIWYSRKQTIQWEFAVAGAYSTGGSTVLLTIAKQARWWGLAPARAVYMKLWADAVSTTAKVNVSIAGNKICSSNSGAGLTIAAARTAYATTTDITWANARIVDGDALEVTVTGGAVADSDLCGMVLFVQE